LDHYSRLVDALLAAGITPWITLYHWDLPQALEDEGGWPSRAVTDYFADYATTVAKHLGDRVVNWMTFNEPACTANLGYHIGRHAPGKTSRKLGFQAAYNVMLAHGKGYDAVKAVIPNAKVGLTNASQNIVCLTRDETSAFRVAYADAETNGIYLEPMFKGTYPQIILDTVGADAPDVRPDDLKIMNRTDFLGVQYYFDTIIRGNNSTSRFDFYEYTEMGWNVTPLGLYEVLMDMHTKYGAKEILVTENGSAWNDTLSPDGTVHDYNRQNYLVKHLDMVRRAIADGSPITGYFAWSFMDNFEWAHGYRPRFGLVYTEYASQKRYIKDTGHLYAQIMKANALEDSYNIPKELLP
jgi:beta-glucosidase